MVTEDYVSFETAKLLKEKGFDAECHSHYYPCHYPDGSIEYHRDKSAQSRNKIWYNVYSLKNLPKDHYLAPTLQMAMKWLREIHKIDIWVECHNTNRRYKGYIHSEQRGDEALFYEDSFEEACEEGIKYCLRNLL